MISKRIVSLAIAFFGLSFAAVHFAHRDHTVNANDQPPGNPAEAPGRPGEIQKDENLDELNLRILHKEISSESFAVTGSGAVWTIAPEGPPRFHNGERVSATETLHLGYDDDLQSITRPPARNQITFFDRGKWHVVPWTKALDRRGDNGPKGRIVAGIDNVVLVVGGDLTLLIQGTEVIDCGELFDLIRKHRDRICRSFGPGVPHPIRRDNWRLNTMIAADDAGHIWCLHDDGLRVLVDETWLVSSNVLVENGKRHGHITFFVPGPDHRYFYIGDQFLRHDGGMSFLAKIDDGHLTLNSTHHAIEGMSLYPAVREQNDGIWIGSPDGRAGSTCDFFDGQSAVRIDRNGEQTHRLKMSGYPVLSDPIGNVWLGQIRGSSRNLFNIVRDGKVIQQVEVPVGHAMDGESSDCAPLFCDKRGSVYLYTGTGLQHMVADEETPHLYRKGRCHSLGKVAAIPRAYSKQGYCIWLVADHHVPMKSMYLAELPANRQLRNRDPNL